MPTDLPLTHWRLLITPPLDGATNMAIDEAILHALAEGVGQPTLRFYQWQPPCLSLGYNQHFSEVNQAACQRLGYTWVRRATGGRAILHTDELTYSIVTSRDDPRVQGGVLHSYRALSQGLLAGLRLLGAAAVQAEGDMPKNPDQGAACFDTPSHYEVTLNGRKLVGSAQVRRKRMVLQHGTLPLHGDLTRIFQVLHFPASDLESLRHNLLTHATTLETELGTVVSFDQAAAALAQGFAQVLHLDLIEAGLSSREQALTKQLRLDQYANDRWNKRV